MTNTLRTKQGTPIIPLPKAFSFIQNGITEPNVNMQAIKHSHY